MRYPHEAKNEKERQEIINENMGLMMKGAEKEARRQGIIPPTRRNAHPELDVQNAVKEWLNLHKVFFYRSDTRGRIVGYDNGRPRFAPQETKGIPDIICVIRGTYIGCEIKSSLGRQSDDQKAFQEALEKAGGLYFLIRSVDDCERYVKPLLTTAQKPASLTSGNT